MSYAQTHTHTKKTTVWQQRPQTRSATTSLTFSATYHEVHGQLPRQTNLPSYRADRPDLRSSHPERGPAGRDLLPDFETDDRQQQQVKFHTKCKSHIASPLRHTLLTLSCSQGEYGPWVAAGVALPGLVPTQSAFGGTHPELPGLTTQRSVGCWLPAEAAGDTKVSLELQNFWTLCKMWMKTKCIDLQILFNRYLIVSCLCAEFSWM